MKKMKNIIDKECTISTLKQKYESVIIDNSAYGRRVYVNLPLTLLERTFFDIISKEVFHLDQTKVLRRIIRKLMLRHPDIVEKAKQRVDESE